MPDIVIGGLIGVLVAWGVVTVRRFYCKPVCRYCKRPVH